MVDFFMIKYNFATTANVTIGSITAVVGHESGTSHFCNSSLS